MKVFLALVLCFLPAIALGKTVPYAIVIGNNAPPESEPGLLPLHYADDDAVRYQQLFSSLDAETRLLAVLDHDTQRRYPGRAENTTAPTLSALLGAVDDFARKMAADRARGDVPIFYLAYSGHGVRPEHGAPYLSLADGALTQELLAERILAKLPARYSHLIIDACHAGAVVGVRGGVFAHEVDAHTVPVAPGEVAAVLDASSILRLPTVGVLLATTAGQEAHEWSRYQSGVFSHEVISGLLGAADVNHDRKIEYSELQAFIAAANRDISDPRAVPHVVAHPPAIDQNAPLVSLVAPRRTLLAGYFARLGAFYIELENGLRYLDAHLGADMLAELVLPLGGRAVLLSREAEAELVLDGKSIDVARLQFKRRPTAARGALDFAYRQGLFATEFSVDYYRGFVDSSGALGVRFAPPVVTGDHRRAVRYRRPLATGLFVAAGVLTAACIATSVLAVQAKQDFDGTTIQRAAHDASARYTGNLGAAIGTGLGAAVTGVAGALVWPAESRVTAPSSSDLGPSVQFFW